MSTVSVTNLKNAASASNNLVLDTSGNTTAAGTVAMGSSFLRNRIINGAMVFWQRGTTGTGAIYVADRWSTDQVNTTQARSTDVPSGAGFLYSLQVSASSGVSATSQKIESFNSLDLASQQVTLSFFAKAATGTPSVNFDLRYANALDNFSSTTIMQGSSVTLSTTWTRYTFTFNALNANVANGIQLFFYNSSAATFLITGVQLEVGTVATPFERRLYGTELALCQRYCYRYSADGSIDNYAPFGIGRYYGTNQAQLFIKFPVTMRYPPGTLTVVGNLFVNDTGFGGTAFTSVILNERAYDGATVTGGATTGTTAGNATTVYSDNTSNAALIFSAEL